MTDNSISPDPLEETTEAAELNVSVDGLSIDGTAPAVGDHVEVKAGGTVSKVVNSIATIKIDTVNDVPMPSTPMVNDDPKDLGAMAAMVDSLPRPY